METQNVKRWFFPLALLPMAALTIPFFIPVFMGVSLACVAMQLRDLGVQELGLRRRLANSLVPTLLVFGFLLVVVFMVVSLSSAVRYVRTEIKLEDISNLFAKIRDSAWLSRIQGFLQKLGIEDFGQVTGDLPQNVLSNLTDPLKNALAQLPALFIGLFIFVLSFLAIYLNENRVKELLLFQGVIPRRYMKVLAHAFSEYTYSSYVAAGVTAIAQGAMIGIGAWLSGAPSAFVFGVIGTLSSLIPYVGTFPVSLALAVLLYAANATTTQYLILLFFALVAGVIDNILRPLIVKSRSDLHPWVAFISIFGGLYFFGLAGVFVGPVLAGMSLDLARELAKDLHEPA